MYGKPSRRVIEFVANRTAFQNTGSSLLVLLRAQTAVRVRDGDGQLLRALDNQLALLGGHSVGDLGTVDAVLHQQHLQLAHVVHQELLEAVREHVAGALVRAVTDVRHQVLALEAAAHSVVDTFRLAPVWLEEREKRYY